MGGVGFVARNFEEIVASTFMVLMSLATILNVIFRYVFNQPFEWAEEFSRYAFIWLVFMGAAVATKQRKHIIIDTLLVALPESVKPAFFLVVDVLTLVLMSVLIYYGWVLMTFATQPTATLKIPQYVVYLCVPLSAASIFVHTLGDLWRNARATVRGGARP